MKGLASMTGVNYKKIVQPEDTALQGCNRSAELDSKTAGRSSSQGLLWPAFCGIDPKAKNPRGFGGLVPQVQSNKTQENPAVIHYATSQVFQFTLNQYTSGNDWSHTGSRCLG